MISVHLYLILSVMHGFKTNGVNSETGVEIVSVQINCTCWISVFYLPWKRMGCKVHHFPNRISVFWFSSVVRQGCRTTDKTLASQSSVSQRVSVCLEIAVPSVGSQLK